MWLNFSHKVFRLLHTSDSANGSKGPSRECPTFASRETDLSTKHQNTLDHHHLAMSTPPMQVHPSPSLPASPLAKRPKPDQSAPMASSTSNHTGDQVLQAPPPPLSHSPPLLVKKLSPRAKTPTRGSAFAAGYDIYSAKDCTIPKRGKGLVGTDISIAVGEGCCEPCPATFNLRRLQSFDS